MAIPDYQSIMLPLLQLTGDGNEHSLRECVDKLSDEFGLTEEDRKELLPSGKQTRFDNRVGWAGTYMIKAGLLSRPRRAYYQITERGKEILAAKPPKLDTKFLAQFEEFVAFQRPSNTETSCRTDAHSSSNETPEEALEEAHQTLQEGLASDIIQNIKGCSPEFFEHLVVDLLVKMGYGGSRKEAGQAVGKGGDGGIDGIIKEDRLGLDIIYIQAKRWENVVGRPEIQKFAGALQGNRARKGIFITTSSFTKEAVEYSERIETKIILIDGKRLADFMIEHNVGTSTVAIYEVKRLDSDYFTEG